MKNNFYKIIFVKKNIYNKNKSNNNKNKKERNKINKKLIMIGHNINKNKFKILLIWVLFKKYNNINYKKNKDLEVKILVYKIKNQTNNYPKKYKVHNNKMMYLVMLGQQH